MAEVGVSIDDDLQKVDVKLSQLKRDYEQYFLGIRKREPINLRREVEKILRYWGNMHIPKAAARFRFNTLNARFFSYRQMWERVVREIENGTYKRDVFKAKLHERERGIDSTAPPRSTASKESADPERETIAAYLDARLACGQANKGLSEAKVRSILEDQRKTLKEKYGCRDIQFRVEVIDGKAMLKASPVRE